MCIMLFCEKTLWQTKNFQNVCSCHHQDGIAVEHNLAVDVPPPPFLQRQAEMQTPLHCVLAKTVQKANTFAVLCTKGKNNTIVFCTKGKNNTIVFSLQKKGAKYQTFYRIFAPKERGKNKKYLSKEKTKMKRTKKGFTLVELLVVIAILAILASVSVVGYTAFIGRANESVALQEMTQVRDALIAADINDKTFDLTDNAISAEDATAINAAYTNLTLGLKGTFSAVEGKCTYELNGYVATWTPGSDITVAKKA